MAWIRKPGPIQKLPGYAEGEFYVQDPSTRHAPALLAVQPGERVLDACAAPGGKAILLAEAMGGEGRLLAIDKHEDRLPRLRENLERLQQDWVEVACHDASVSLGESFDAILLDVPCSNTGVLARRPEARWRFNPNRLRSLTALQRSLLDVAWSQLVPGGRLVYSTCSIEAEETSELIDRFLTETPGARETGRQLVLPGARDSDGAFACRIEKA